MRLQKKSPGMNRGCKKSNSSKIIIAQQHWQPLPTDAEIQQALEELLETGVIKGKYLYHENHDCTRIAFAWFDAQKTVKHGKRWGTPLKHVIESWGQRYVSTDSVIIAAHLHPRIRGSYPAFNLSARLTRPAPERLLQIAEAGAHPNYAGKYPRLYKVQEVIA